MAMSESDGEDENMGTAFDKQEEKKQPTDSLEELPLIDDIIAGFNVDGLFEEASFDVLLSFLTG